MLRLRVQRINWPKTALVLTDTPRPDCRDCEGDGGIAHDYGDQETGEYAGTDWEPCPCWSEHRRWTLLRLPRRPRWLPRRTCGGFVWGSGGYSDEPPF